MAVMYDPVTMGTGFPDIDAQHKELLSHLNRLVEMMQAGRGQDELRPLMAFLLDYTRKHFSHEEGCMARHQCPVAAQNKIGHARFVAMLEDFQRALDEKGPTVTLVLRAQRELSQWIREHIIRTDTHLRQCAAVA